MVAPKSNRLIGLKRTIVLFYNLIFSKQSYFVKQGYIQSRAKHAPLDKDGNPLPWMNYAILDFFKEKLNKNLTLFEYGSGYSTLYFSERVKSVTSIEYDEGWYNIITQNLNLINSKIILYALNEGYENAIQKESMDSRYDIILIDGRKRVECSKIALDYLSKDGILILDDSHREKYSEVFDFYFQKGFKKLTFSGLKPTGFRGYSTTIFYRSNQNCFQI